MDTPLYNQTGEQTVNNFADILAGLSPELLAAFEAARDTAQTELDDYVATNGYNT